ncbi:hypothetical protein CTEN210_18278 [Chaetoceros tenuissimus]|uniref:Leucine-rich repeat domain-containing protein n=1 Tax=Chaetoceros tenuissimus TaxID=426638 RepID=A0AAD3HFA8_9STRA|nr:hypothetical protein CTEN210_18278 [Chaetoceros tenuissimus]
MRVQTEEWRRFIPGVRMYKGKKTLFYNGEILREGDGTNPLIYNREERLSWKVIIVLPGVRVIPDWTFWSCKNVEKVIMSDTVRRIEWGAFSTCISLEFVKLSQTLEFIGVNSFQSCVSLTSIFIPPSCREICNWAFNWCSEFIIFHVPQHTLIGRNVFELGKDVIRRTKLFEASPFYGHDNDYNAEEVNTWIKNINMNEEYELHRACSSFNPIEDIVYGIVRRKGLSSFQAPNALGITPAQYLAANPYADIDQHKLIKRYIAEMMGEPV